jgi:hypothetical protein
MPGKSIIIGTGISGLSAGRCGQMNAYHTRIPACWQGSWLGWATTPEAMNLHMSRTLPGLGVSTWWGHGS